MLVPKAWVDEWYKSDHAIRKSFTYLFKNPLWDVPVPKGFSVCPYFWMSVLLSPLFRLLVVYPVLIIRWILNVSRLGKFDKWLFDKAYSSWIENKYMNGIAVFLSFIIFLAVSLICFLFYKIYCGYIFVLNYVESNGQSSIPIMISFWGILAGIVTVLAVEYYRAKNANDDGKKCKVEIYLYIWAMGFFALSLFFCFDLYVAFFNGIVIGVVNIFAGLWWLLKTIGWSFKVSGVWCAQNFMMFVGWILAIIASCFAVIVAGVCFLLFLSALGWVAMLFNRKTKAGKKKQEEKEEEENPIDYVMLRWRKDWLTIICTEMYMASKNFIREVLGEELVNNDVFSDIMYRLQSHMDDDVFENALKEIDGIEPRRWDHSGDLEAFERCKRMLNRVSFSGSEQMKYIFSILNEKILPDVKEHEQKKLEIRKINVKKRKIAEARSAKWEKRCQAVTGFLGRIFIDPFKWSGPYLLSGLRIIAVPFVLLFVFVCWLFLTIWNGIKFSTVFFSLLWTVLVAGKKKACPYIVFED